MNDEPDIESKTSAMISLSDILEVENDPEILYFKCEETGIPLWFSIRVSFLKMLISDLNAPRRSANQICTRRAYPVKLKNILSAFVHNYLRNTQKKSNVVITASGAGTFTNGGVYKNRLSDYFASLVDDTLVYEDVAIWEWPMPRYHDHVLFHDPFKYLTSISARISAKSINDRKADQLIDYVKERSYSTLGWVLSIEREKKLRALLNHSIRVLPVRYRWYQHFFKKMDTQVLIGKSLSYGPGDMVAAAKDLHIVVAEYQHGTIHKGHYAYNFAPALVDTPELKKVLPDHFLGYGKMWNDQINLPSQKHEIGNPHLSEQIKEIRKQSTKKNKREILILGNYLTDKYVDLARQLSTNLSDDFTVVLRPHPQQRRFFSGDYIKSEYENIFIDQRRNIYESFQSADIVIGESSTGLYEAINIVDRILVWDTPISRFILNINHPFSTFQSVQELVPIIEDGSTGYVQSDEINDIWAPNWKENYLNFLREYGGIDC